MPRKVFTAGEILTAADVNTNLMDQSVMVFAGTAARGSAIPSPSEGMVTYRSDDDVVEVFDGSVFKAVGPGKVLQVVSVKNTTETSSATSGVFIDTSTTATITPSSTSSKVLVLISSTVVGLGGQGEVTLALFRGDVTGTNVYQTRIFSDSSNGHAASIVHLDSPSTTSPQQYMLGITKPVGTTTMIDSDGATRASSITLMEVAG